MHRFGTTIVPKRRTSVNFVTSWNNQWSARLKWTPSIGHFLGDVKEGPVTDVAQVQMFEELSPHKPGLDRTTLVEPGNPVWPTT